MVMEKNEKTITLSVSDFKQIIADEVSKNLQEQAKNYTPQNVFNYVAMRSEDIAVINSRSPIVTEWMDKQGQNRGGMYQGAVYSQNFFNTSGWGKTYKVTDTTIHELLRKLSVTVLGHTTNGDIRYDEFEQAQEFYDQFKNLWLKMYENRLQKCDSDKKMNETIVL